MAGSVQRGSEGLQSFAHAELCVREWLGSGFISSMHTLGHSCMLPGCGGTTIVALQRCDRRCSSQVFLVHPDRVAAQVLVVGLSLGHCISASLNSMVHSICCCWCIWTSSVDTTACQIHHMCWYQVVSQRIVEQLRGDEE